MHEIGLLREEIKKLGALDVHKVYIFACTLSKIREEQNKKEEEKTA